VTIAMSERALSRTAFWILLLVHCFAGLQLFVLLVGVAPRFDAMFARLRERAELPSLTVFVMFLSQIWVWLLGFGLSLDAAVLYALGRLPKKLRWSVVTWFSSVLVAIVAILVLTILGLYMPVLRMSATL